MAVKAKPAKAAKPPLPADLKLDLYAPGMTALHRAGLGGLACTLRWLERAEESGVLDSARLPGDWTDGPPWEINQRQVVLKFGQAALAGEFLKRLFAAAFQIKDGMMYLPGQYGDVPPSLAVRAELQNGLTLTFLQHGGTRDLAKEPTELLVDPDGTGQAMVPVQFKKCSWYKHQDGYEALQDKAGRLTAKAVEVIGPLSPGAMVRHNAFAGETRIEDDAGAALALHFALVGCLALPVNRGVGVLVVPEVDDLLAFAAERPSMTPMSARECRIAGAGDAALQAIVRVRMRAWTAAARWPGCSAVEFRPTPWASQQKSRVGVVEVSGAPVAGNDSEEVLAERLDQFETALALLPPRVHYPKLEPAQPQAVAAAGPGKKPKAAKGKTAKPVASKPTAAAATTYWNESLVRPLIADNLARGERWYCGFARLMSDNDTAGKVAYETKGLQQMATNKTMLSEEDELLFVKSLHRAIANGLARIYEDTMGKERAKANVKADPATQKRWQKMRDRVRLGLVGAKTSSQTQAAVSEILAAASYMPELKEAEAGRRVQKLLFGADWQRVRNLALFALASYRKPENAKPGAPDDAKEIDG